MVNLCTLYIFKKIIFGIQHNNEKQSINILFY